MKSITVSYYNINNVILLNDTIHSYFKILKKYAQLNSCL